MWITASLRGQRGVDIWVWKDTGEKVRTLRCMQIRAKFTWKLHADYPTVWQEIKATSCGEKIGRGGDHYLGFQESSFVWHLPLKTPGSKKTASNSSKLWENEVAWLPTQCSLMSISLCLSAGSWRCIEWEGSCCLFIWNGQDKCYLALATSTKACTSSRASQEILIEIKWQECILIYFFKLRHEFVKRNIAAAKCKNINKQACSLQKKRETC